MNGYIELAKRDIVRIGIKDENGNTKLDKDGHEVFIEFDLEDINLLDNYSQAISLCEKAGKTLQSELVIIEKKQDSKLNDFITKNQKAKMEALKKYYQTIEEAMNLFLGEDGFTKIFGKSRYLTMLDDLAKMLEPIMPLLKVNVDNIHKKIITKYKQHEDDVLKDEDE